MLETPPARPAPLSRVWSGTKIIAEDLDGDDLSDVLQLHEEASAWWVLDRTSLAARRSLRELADALDLDEAAIADLLADDDRAKFEQLGQSRLVLTNAVSLDAEAGRLTVTPVSLLVTDRALICLAEERAGRVLARLLVTGRERLAQGGVEAGLQLIVADLVAGYAVVLEWLEDSCDRLAEVLFEERPLDRGEQLWAFKLRTGLTQLRRLTDPMRAVLADLAVTGTVGPARRTGASRAGSPQTGPAESGRSREWAALIEQHTRVANAADSLREALSSVFDTSLALGDLRLNQVMKKLTGWAAIIAVPTLITGFAGMNVQFPLDGTGLGFWVYLVIMILACAGLYAMFRRRDWI